MFRNTTLLARQEHEEFVREYIRSQTFNNYHNHFIWSSQDFTGRLITLAGVILIICKEFSTTLKEKTSDSSSRYSHMASKMSSILLRLYEQAQGEQNGQIADQWLEKLLHSIGMLLIS